MWILILEFLNLKELEICLLVCKSIKKQVHNLSNKTPLVINFACIAKILKMIPLVQNVKIGHFSVLGKQDLFGICEQLSQCKKITHLDLWNQHAYFFKFHTFPFVQMLRVDMKWKTLCALANFSSKLEHLHIFCDHDDDANLEHISEKEIYDTMAKFVKLKCFHMFYHKFSCLTGIWKLLLTLKFHFKVCALTFHENMILENMKCEHQKKEENIAF